MCPEMTPTDALYVGQVGYVITGLKSTKAVRVGDTWHAHKAADVKALPGFKPAKAMMFAGACVRRCSLSSTHDPPPSWHAGAVMKAADAHAGISSVVFV